MKVSIHAVSVILPGVENWALAQPVLLGQARVESRPVVVPISARLPATERRRVGLSVKLALALAEQLFANSAIAASEVATIFSSSGGDGENCHILCEALAQAQPSLSPTRFTNSVHNAPAGYWGIAAQSRPPSSSLCAYDASFAAGLIEAAVYAQYEPEPVALIAYDVSYPEPLNSKRHIPAPAGIALLLAAPGKLPAPLASIELMGYETGEATTLDDPLLESLRQGIPAARGLPLLVALARRSAGVLKLAGNRDQVLPIEVRFE
jgi:hypothetical protein